MNPPCKHCDKKGCGSHHDQCPEYQEFRKLIADRDKVKDTRREYNSYKHYVIVKSSKRSIRRSESSPLKGHRR